MKRLLFAISLIFLLFTIGSISYYYIGKSSGENWSFVQSMYMTAVTISTVGYEDLSYKSNSPTRMVFTVILIFFSMITVTYGISNVTAFLVESNIRKYFKQRYIMKYIRKLEKHCIICGGGDTAIHTIRELYETEKKFIVIEREEEVIKNLEKLFPKLLYVKGDADDDEVLKKAGVIKAYALATALPEDKDNLYVIVTARQMNPKLRIIAKCINLNSKSKFEKAGADKVVLPQLTGGIRLAAEMIRPSVVNFLDKMLSAREKAIHLEELQVMPGSDVCNKKLMNTSITEKTGLMVIAILEPNDDDFIYNPNKDACLLPYSVIVVIGTRQNIEKLKKMLN